jgi:hypothetical protein
MLQQHLQWCLHLLELGLLQPKLNLRNAKFWKQRSRFNLRMGSEGCLKAAQKHLRFFNHGTSAGWLTQGGIVGEL